MNNGSPRGGPPLQMLDDAWPTNPHPERPEELSDMVLDGPPLQMLDEVEPTVAVTSIDTKLFDDLVARVGPDAIQKLLDKYRRTAVSRAG